MHKRLALMKSGHAVWVLSWHDLSEENTVFSNAIAQQLMDRSDPATHQIDTIWAQLAAQNGWSSIRACEELWYQNPFQQLSAWLQKPEAPAALWKQALTQQPRARALQDHLDQEIMNGEWFALAAVVPQDALRRTQALLTLPELYLAVDDTVIEHKDEFLPAWRSIWYATNLLQFAPVFGAVALTGLRRGGVDSLLEQRPPDTTFMPPDHQQQAWQEELKLIDPEYHDLTIRLSALGLPVPEAGYDFQSHTGAVQAIAEMAWVDEKIALFAPTETPPELPGWQVLSLSDADCNFKQYISEATVALPNSADEPDQQFFTKKVLNQVRGSSYWRAWKDGYLSQDQLTGVPTFYCGGGMRMPFYDRLRKEMASTPSFTWLQAVSRRVELPSNLVAPGLRRENFDRMTVAFGLSFLEVSKLTKAIPLPKLKIEPSASWTDNYIGKDLC